MKEYEKQQPESLKENQENMSHKPKREEEEEGTFQDEKLNNTF